jgi:integrase
MPISQTRVIYSQISPESCKGIWDRHPPDERRTMKVKIGCHTFRATGITAYLEAGGTLENAQAMAAHESPRTTKLYERTERRNYAR